MVPYFKFTPYFKLERRTRQGDPVSTYLFILALEVVFSLIKANPDIKGLQVLVIHSYTLLMQMTLLFFIGNEKSATEVIKTFGKFSLFSGLKINNAKCEIAGIVVKKGVKMAFCGMDCIDLTDDVIKLLGIYFSYNKKL